MTAERSPRRQAWKWRVGTAVSVGEFGIALVEIEQGKTAAAIFTLAATAITATASAVYKERAEIEAREPHSGLPE